MLIFNGKMYHFRYHDSFDDIWQPGNTIQVGPNFNAPKQIDVAGVATGVKINGTSIVRPVTDLIDYTMCDVNDILDKASKKNIDSKELLAVINRLSSLLKGCRRIIDDTQKSIIERALEEVRRQNYDFYPSRLNSLSVSDKEHIKYWASVYPDSDLFELNLLGNIFKTSAELIPQEGLSLSVTKMMSFPYWDPKFDSAEVEEKTEYLFNGSARVLRKVDKKEFE